MNDVPGERVAQDQAAVHDPAAAGTRAGAIA